MARPTLDPAREAAPERPGRSAQAVRWRQARHRHRLALVLTLGLIAVVAVSLPFALESMRTQLFGDQSSDIYDLVSGQVLTPAAAARSLSQSFVTISIVHIDEGKQVVSLSIAANRKRGASGGTDPSSPSRTRSAGTVLRLHGASRAGRSQSPSSRSITA